MRFSCTETVKPILIMWKKGHWLKENDKKNTL